jgi:hypothetical protein
MWTFGTCCARGASGSITVAHTGNPHRPVYRCDKPNLMMGLLRCMTFGGPRVDVAIARELLRAEEPMPIDAALEAERMHREQQEDPAHQQAVLHATLEVVRSCSGVQSCSAAARPDRSLTKR